MEHLSLMELYQMKWRFKKENRSDFDFLEDILSSIKNKEKQILEDTSATGVPSVGGMGPYVNSQPSGLAGATIGPNWASHGGVEGDGSVAVPLNPSGSNRVFQNIPAPEMGKNHGSRTGKKSRVKKLDIKSLKDVFAKRQDFTAGAENIKGKGKVMNFNNFLKNDFTTIKKESLNDIVIVIGDYGKPIIAYKEDVDNDKLSLMDGYFGGTAFIGSENSEDEGSVDFSSPFHKGQVLHDVEHEVREELDFNYHKSIPENIVRKHLDEFVSKGYNGKIVKIYYH
jgi:hypothetical protein